MIKKGDSQLKIVDYGIT